MTSTVLHVETVGDVSFDASCIVIADAGLPRVILDALPDPILLDSGEALKSLSSIESLATKVLARRATRPLTLVAAGGGSLGDAVGFLASILWRGVTLWQIPTTLLAMADSAHGGKTAVNLGSAKNQLGIFHVVKYIFIARDILASLPARQRREGFVEILKALLISDTRIIDTLTPEEVEELVFRPFEQVSDRLLALLSTAIEAKLAVVMQDPREERGIRTVLNLGHTIGHALELGAGIPHADAVAWGLRTMLELSADTGLLRTAADHIAALLFPLLRPFDDAPTRDALHSALGFDKKRHGGALRSVLLQDVGKPLVTESIGSDEWITAFEKSHAAFSTASVNAWLRDAQMTLITPGAGKSEVNRALILAAQRSGTTRIEGRSDSADARHMLAALKALGVPVREIGSGYLVDHARMAPPSNAPREIDCGSGGTTFRFLLALAAANRKETVLRVSPQLAGRPHEPLIHALRNGGAVIDSFTDTRGTAFRVRGWESMPLSFSVDASLSSQFASAIALLAAGSDKPFTLRLLDDVSSRPYFDLTLRMLHDAGVEYLENGGLIAFNPTPRLDVPVIMRMPADASSAAVWKVAQYFEHMLQLPPTWTGGPDARIDELLDTILGGQRSEEIVLDCAPSPDLVPVLAIAALRSSRSVRIVGVPQLRIKESNRIDDFIASLLALGIHVDATADGMRIPAEAARGIHDGLFDSRDDHRLLMAGFLLSMITGDVNLSHPWCVTKSYPEFWDHARTAGWSVKMSSA